MQYVSGLPPGMQEGYFGETAEGIRHGQGTYIYPGGFFAYSGQWRDGVKHGQGTFYMGDGSSYEGAFVDGEIQGHGLRRYADGGTYSGVFRMGERHGQGVELAANGDRYEGMWANNQRHGKGILVLADGTRYEGTFVRHARHGSGSLRAANGDAYTGGWYKNRRHGEGDARYANGDSYSGEWHKGKRHGSGRLYHAASGLVYLGEWVNDAIDTPTVLRLVPPPPDQLPHDSLLAPARSSAELVHADSGVKAGTAAAVGPDKPLLRADPRSRQPAGPRAASRAGTRASGARPNPARRAAARSTRTRAPSNPSLPSVFGADADANKGGDLGGAHGEPSLAQAVFADMPGTAGGGAGVAALVNISENERLAAVAEGKLLQLEVGDVLPRLEVLACLVRERPASVATDGSGGTGESTGADLGASGSAAAAVASPGPGSRPRPGSAAAGRNRSSRPGTRRPNPRRTGPATGGSAKASAAAAEAAAKAEIEVAQPPPPAIEYLPVRVESGRFLRLEIVRRTLLSEQPIPPPLASQVERAEAAAAAAAAAVTPSSSRRRHSKRERGGDKADKTDRSAPDKTERSADKSDAGADVDGDHPRLPGGVADQIVQRPIPLLRASLSRSEYLAAERAKQDDASAALAAAEGSATAATVAPCSSASAAGDESTAVAENDAVKAAAASDAHNGLPRSAIAGLPMVSVPGKTEEGSAVFDSIQLPADLAPGANYRLMVYDETKGTERLAEIDIEVHIYPRGRLRHAPGAAKPAPSRDQKRSRRRRR
ncbi:MORN repeat protein [Thecamonas trahens ATCC 50062]|uniref:MORN repeat protein n=1 Tax=Thecamonas trahens ATCC 50062 TaxID=461836 RepID=A0A0L0DEJ1_THETB|nr:MORN repeat protein [Thecamonas trahens ATCC 50062]KNC50625.1 MORN repeat protein [Thecamonas trahens ATCC 50062]|eukprot:XP_013762512.1 MORN repeat protein [Thecamonas trahens ATCC 50062]